MIHVTILFHVLTRRSKLSRVHLLTRRGRRPPSFFLSQKKGIFKLQRPCSTTTLSPPPSEPNHAPLLHDPHDPHAPSSLPPPVQVPWVQRDRSQHRCWPWLLRFLRRCHCWPRLRAALRAEQGASLRAVPAPLRCRTGGPQLTPLRQPASPGQLRPAGGPLTGREGRTQAV
jgi:hypothetical protein